MNLEHGPPCKLASRLQDKQTQYAKRLFSPRIAFRCFSGSSEQIYIKNYNLSGLMLPSLLSIHFLLMSLGIFPAWDRKSGSALRDLFLKDAGQLTPTRELLPEVMTALMQDGKWPLNYNQAWEFVKSLSREPESWPLRRKQQKSLLA